MWADYLRGREPGSRWGRWAIAVYVAASLTSVAWALSGGTAPDNELRAEIRWEVASGFPTLVLTNLSDDDWTSVYVELDDRYFHLEERVPEGQSVAITRSQFLDGYHLPRADGMYTYELTLRREAPPEPLLGADYAPGFVRVRCDQGEAERRLVP